MLRIMLLLFVLLPAYAHAVVCKTVEPDGSVSYADVAASDCPDPIKLPDYSRYEPRAIEQATATNGGSAESASKPFSGYETFVIVQPESNGTVRDNNGNVPVTLALQPGLQPGHLITLYLDGRAVTGSFDGLAMELSGVERGPHHLRAVVIDAEGHHLIESQDVQFTMRKRGLNDRASKPEPKDPDSENPEQGSTDTSSDDTNGTPDYTSDAGSTNYNKTPAADYSPASSSSSNYKPNIPGNAPLSTPGRTNPAYSPANAN